MLYEITILSYNLNGVQMLGYWIRDLIDIVSYTHIFEFIFYLYFVVLRWLGKG